MNALRPIAKALVATGVAVCGAGATAAVSNGISGAEWWTIAGAGFAALALVWRVPNTTDPGS